MEKEMQSKVQQGKNSEEYGKVWI